MTFFLNFALYFIYDCYMKRLISLLFIIVLFASCSSRKEFSMNYEVRVDTIGHYLDVCMVYEANDIMKVPSSVVAYAVGSTFFNSTTLLQHNMKHFKLFFYATLVAATLTAVEKRDRNGLHWV